MCKQCALCGRSLTTRATIERGICKKCIPRNCDVRIEVYRKKGITKTYITESLFTNNIKDTSHEAPCQKNNR